MTIFTYVNDFDDPRIPKGAMYVFGRHTPGQERRDELIKSLVNTSDAGVPFRKAEDSESTYQSRWKNATASTSSLLNNVCREDQCLYFSKKLVYQTTEVSGTKHNSNQLCVFWDVPSQDEVDTFQSFPMLVAPAGCKEIPNMETITSKQQLFDEGWKEVKIGKCRETTHFLKNRLRGKRRQYALKIHVTATIHGAMGHTFNAMCSKVEANEKSLYRLWSREQAIVLMSRTRSAKDNYFVGSPSDTADALIAALKTKSQYFDYMTHILDAFLKATDDEMAYILPAEMNAVEHPFRPIGTEIPSDASGYCYVLASLRHSDVTYIGETHN